MTTAEQIKELAEALDRDAATAEQRALDAEENLLRAKTECEDAQQEVLRVQKYREGFRQTFAEVLGLSSVREAHTAVETKQQERSLQLAQNTKALAKMTVADQLKHVLGTETMTLDQIRTELKVRKLKIPANLSKVLGTSCHNVLSADGSPMRDPKTEALLKQPTFVRVQHGSWRVAETARLEEKEAASVVLTKGQVCAEMIMNRVNWTPKSGHPHARLLA